MMKNIYSLVASVCFFLAFEIQPVYSQVIIEGYAFESGNRGFLNEVFVEVYNAETNELISRSRSSTDGKFVLTGPAGKSLLLKGRKDLFHETEMAVSTIDKLSNEKVFVKLEMKRAPGYIFDITMAEKREEGDEKVDAIRGALVEVYNNTTREPIIVLEDHPHPDFRVNLEKGNHYTIMLRKEGYLAKRMEAFVNVKGCILCFEGVGEVQPGVSDNLTEGNQMGTLLANVELDKLYTGKKITLNNIYYDFGKASIRKDAVEELQNAITFLVDNPRVYVELAAHTDSRGLEAKNQTLSEKRAKNTVKWILENSDLPAYRITARGYGETKLLNKCDNSADCTETQHAINRRTEFKILAISAPTETFKSLEKIKLEENMDDIIAELQREGTVKVEDEKDLDKIKGNGIKIEVEDVEKVSDNTKEIKEIEAKTEAVRKPALNVSDAKDIEKPNDLNGKEMREGAVHKLEEYNKAEKVKAIDKLEEVKASRKEAAANTVTKVEAEVISSKEEEVKAKADKVTTISKVEAKEKLKDETEKAVKAAENTTALRLNTIGDFTGYKYVILFSGEALADEHDVFQNHEDIEILQTGANNFLYMIGNYATEVYANSGLSTIKKKYPEAYVIGFIKGVRIE